MKTFLLFCSLLLGNLAAHGEDSVRCCTSLPDDPFYELTASPGSLTYTVALTGDPLFYGFGTFIRSGNLLSYELRTVPVGFDVAQIRAPLGSSDAQVIFGLRRRDCFSPSPDDYGSCIFFGTLTLSDSQIADLDSGAWFVRSFRDPVRFIEGPIVSVPEPSIWSLVFAGFVVCWLCSGRRTRDLGKPLIKE